MCTQLKGMTDMSRQDSMICASDLRSGMSDEQLVLLHGQISTDPHRTLYQVANISRKIQEVTFFETQRLQSISTDSHHASIWLWRCVGDRQVAARLGEASLLDVNGTCGEDAEFFRSIERSESNSWKIQLWEAKRLGLFHKWGNWKAPLIKPTQLKQYALASIWLWRCVGDCQSPTGLGETSFPHVNGTCREDAEFFHSIEMLPLFKLPWRIYDIYGNLNTCNFDMQRCKRWESIWNLGTLSGWNPPQPVEHPQTTSNNISKNSPSKELPSPPHQTSASFRGWICDGQSPTGLGEVVKHVNRTCWTAENPHFFTGKRCSKFYKHLYRIGIQIILGNRKEKVWKSPITLNVFYPYLRGVLIQPQLLPFGNFESSHLFHSFPASSQDKPRMMIHTAKKQQNFSPRTHRNPWPRSRGCGAPHGRRGFRARTRRRPSHCSGSPRGAARRPAPLQGPQGDHREVPVEVDRVAEVKAFLQEERDALRGILLSRRANVNPWPQTWLMLRMKSAAVMRIM